MKEKTKEISAQALLYRIMTGRLPFLLDVRTEEDRDQWRIETSAGLEELNVPYIDFIEAPDEVIPKLPKDREIVVLCGKGGASAFVADMLRGRGFDAKNVTGGMKAWGAVYTSGVVWQEGGRKVVQFNRVGKGCLSYMIVSGGEAAVIDPSRHAEQYISEAIAAPATLRYIFDTHLHADHISGADKLRDSTLADYYISRRDMEGAKRDYLPLVDGRRFELGGAPIEVMAISSPGHTPGSTSFLFDGKVLFTGDTLFLSSMGRPDLGGMAEAWVKDLWNTVRKLEHLPDETLVLPSHTAGVSEMNHEGKVVRTLGELRKINSLLTIRDEGEFSGRVLESLPEEPDSYQKMRRANLGVDSPDEDEMDQWELGRNRCAIEASKQAAAGK